MEIIKICGQNNSAKIRENQKKISRQLKFLKIKRSNDASFL